MDSLTQAQCDSLATLKQRFSDLTEPEPLFGGAGCVMVRTGTLWIGIEPDGYAHT